MQIITGTNLKLKQLPNNKDRTMALIIEKPETK